MEVKLLSHTENPEQVIAAAAKLCYSQKADISTLLHDLTPEKVEKFVQKLESLGHCCYDAKTEVLTDHGFKPWPKVTEDDKLAAINPDDRSFHGFETPSRLIASPVVDEDMVCYKTDDIDLMVTKNHRLYCSLSNSVTNRVNPTFSLMKASDIAQDKYKTRKIPVYQKPMRMVKTAINNSHSYGNGDAIYKLYGFFIGDGYVHGATPNLTDKSCTLHFHLRLNRKIEYLREICKECGVELKEVGDKFSVKAPALGKLFGSLFYNENGEKTFPLHFFDMSCEQFENFYDGLINSDGSKKRSTYVYDTTSVELRDRLQALFALNGKAASIILEHPAKENIAADYRLNINSRRIMPHLNDSRKPEGCAKIEKYTGNVYCATVSTGLLVVRRNNKVCLSGNSPFEHCAFTFGIEGVSRALLSQITRHRIGASFSVRSQRYCSEDDFQYVIPKSIQRHEKHCVRYKALMADIQNLYNKLVELGVPKEDARMILPNACETRMIVTMNVRELWHFFNLRCCNRAQWEIRELANKMLELCKEASPLLFEHAGAACVKGYCPEGDMSCGKAPTLDALRTAYVHEVLVS